MTSTASPALVGVEVVRLRVRLTGSGSGDGPRVGRWTVSPTSKPLGASIERTRSVGAVAQMSCLAHASGVGGLGLGLGLGLGAGLGADRVRIRVRVRVRSR